MFSECGRLWMEKWMNNLSSMATDKLMNIPRLIAEIKPRQQWRVVVKPTRLLTIFLCVFRTRF